MARRTAGHSLFGSADQWEMRYWFPPSTDEIVDLRITAATENGHTTWNVSVTLHDGNEATTVQGQGDTFKEASRRARAQLA